MVFTLGAAATGGSLLTGEFARRARKPCVHISPNGNFEPAAGLRRFVQEHGIKTLNVAGSRESEEPGIGQCVYQVIEDAFFRDLAHPGMIGGPGEG